MSKKSAAGSGTIRKKTVTRSGKQYAFWEGRAIVGYDPATGKPIRRSVSAKTQAEARKKLQEILTAVDQGTYTQPTKLTVGQWVGEWISTYATNSVKDYTLSTYRQILKNHIQPHLGAVPLQGLRGNHVQKFYNDLTKQGLSGKTVKNINAVLHKALTKAVKLGYIQANPCDAADLPKVKNKEIHPLTDEEIPRFLQAIENSPMRNAFAVCLFCGLRRGELTGLPWCNVDFDKQEITISQQLQLSKEKGVGYAIKDYTKSGKPRTIKPPAIAFEYLKAERALQNQNRLKAGSTWANEWGLVFTDALGRHYANDTTWKRFKEVARSIGRPDLRPHDLRHTCATAAIAAGADIKSVQSLMGHATAAFTLDKYAHTSEKMMQDTANRLQDYYASLQAVK